MLLLFLVDLTMFSLQFKPIICLSSILIKPKEKMIATGLFLEI